MAVAISPENRGLQRLQRLVSRVIAQGYRVDLFVPIVLVSGFSGWGEALFGTFNYWGGFEDLPTALNNAGYTVIVVRIGPLSSNWERACEVYAQLNSGVFDTPIAPVPTTIPIDYGPTYPAQYGYNQLSNTKTGVLFGQLSPGWRWSARNPVHFISHSQGGNTIRMLIELMSGNKPAVHPAYFPAGNRQDWIKSLVTLGTPHKGTTVTDVVQGLLPPNSLNLITQLVISVSFKTPRFYDLQLDHWGFVRGANETFTQMQTRLRPIVQRWWNGPPTISPQNGFYDNSIPGVRNLNNFAGQPSNDTYYFTMSFDATVGFPDESLTSNDLAAFPSPVPSNQLTNPFINFFSGLGAGMLGLGSKLPGVPNIVELAKWFVKVANSHLGRLGYFNRIPTPGPRVPRADMLPALLVTSYGMGGFDGSGTAIATGLPPNISFVDLQSNDGIVNTVSMRGPNDASISDAVTFPFQSLGNVVGATPARGVYWHLGINKTMDHADEIGVFTEGQTYLEIQYMYVLFAQLLTRLP